MWLGALTPDPIEKAKAVARVGDGSCLTINEIRLGGEWCIVFALPYVGNELFLFRGVLM